MSVPRLLCREGVATLLALCQRHNNVDAPMPSDRGGMLKLPVGQKHLKKRGNTEYTILASVNRNPGLGVGIRRFPADKQQCSEEKTFKNSRCAELV
jgi:hypothetical protein